MTVLNFIIAVVALVIAILAYKRVGGANDLSEQVTSLHSLREKTADMLEKWEKIMRKGEDDLKTEENKE